MFHLKNITIVCIIILTSACTNLANNLANNLQDPAIWQRIAEINERYDTRREQQRTGVYGGENEVIDLAGEWSFRHQGSNRANRIVHGYGSIMVVPVGNPGASVRYSEIGINLYQSDNGATYEFDTIHTGQWRSNDKRNLVINLRRTSWQ
jgi:hypothetical protein